MALTRKQAGAPAQTSTSNTGVTNPKSSILESLSIKEFLTDFGFVQIVPEIRGNVNGYPFITFINEDNKAENVYFAKTVADKYPVGTTFGKGFFDELIIVITEAEDGEQRVKLTERSTGMRVNAMDLL